MNQKIGCTHILERIGCNIDFRISDLPRTLFDCESLSTANANPSWRRLCLPHYLWRYFASALSNHYRCQRIHETHLTGGKLVIDWYAKSWEIHWDPSTEIDGMGIQTKQNHTIYVTIWFTECQHLSLHSRYDEWAHVHFRSRHGRTSSQCYRNLYAENNGKNMQVPCITFCAIFT